MAFFFQAEDGIRDSSVTGVQTCAFLFSSRRRHTRFKCDWSSDVCSSDLTASRPESIQWAKEHGATYTISHREAFAPQLKRLGFESVDDIFCLNSRSEERRVGKECRSRWSPYH